jgi:multidrug efflux system membrane fusion protein
MTNLKHLAAACLFGLCVAGSVLAADVSAVIHWSRSVELGTLVSGVVSDVYVKPGQAVSKGDRLISLDDRGFSSQLSKHEAAYRLAQAALAEARREDERAIELYDRTVLSDFERNQAQLALLSARAAAEAAHADMIEARLNLERSEILAPFDGVVLSVNAAPGQTVVSEWQSQPLVTIADNRVYQAHAQIDANQAARLQQGQSLRATARGGDLDASVSYIGLEPAGESAQGPRYELITEIASKDNRSLRVGETVILHLDD